VLQGDALHIAGRVEAVLQGGEMGRHTDEEEALDGEGAGDG